MLVPAFDTEHGPNPVGIVEARFARDAGAPFQARADSRGIEGQVLAEAEEDVFEVATGKALLGLRLIDPPPLCWPIRRMPATERFPQRSGTGDHPTDVK